MRAIIIVAIAILFANFFVRDYNRGGKRFHSLGRTSLEIFVLTRYLILDTSSNVCFPLSRLKEQK